MELIAIGIALIVIALLTLYVCFGLHLQNKATMLEGMLANALEREALTKDKEVLDIVAAVNAQHMHNLADTRPTLH